MTGGTLAGCTVVSNLVIAPSSASGGGIYMNGAGSVVDRCRIAYNEARSTSVNYGGGGVTLASGILRNSVVAGNYANGAIVNSFGGGVKQEGGRLENCTIVRNATLGNLSDGGGVHRTGGTITNCIVYHNTTRSGGAAANIAVGAAFYSCAPELTNGTGNITSDPGFIAAGSGSGLSAVLGDYHLLARTPCVDAGTNTSAALDYEGEVRPIDGTGDGAALYDLGAYENNPTSGGLRCNFFASTNSGFGSVQVIFTAYVEGADTVNLQYYWDFDNNGVTTANGPDLGQVTNTYAVGGFHSVALTVSNATEGFTLVKPNLIGVLSDGDAHVATNGSHTTPFDTWAKAATNIQAAVDLMQALVTGGGTHRTVWISKGTYLVTAPVTVTGDITVRGTNGPAETLVDGNAAAVCFSVNSPGAIVDGLTLTNGLGASDPSGLLLLNGLVTNCTITGCRTYRAALVQGGTLAGCTVANNTNGIGGGVFMSGGTVRGCTITNNRAYYGLRPSVFGGSGVYMTAGTLADSLIAGNQNQYGEQGWGSGVYMTGGLVTNCMIRKNGNVGSSGNHFRGGGVYLAGGTLVSSTIISNQVVSPISSWGGGLYVNSAGALVDGCLIAYNECRNGGTAGNGGGGLHLADGVVRNSVIAGNYANGSVNSTYGGGLRMGGGRLENCTVVRNTVNGNASDGGGLYWTGGAVTNCIVYYNTTRVGGGIVNLTNAAVYSCAPELTNGVGNLTGDPGFIAAGSGAGLTATLGDYHLLARTACVDAGTNTAALLDYDRYTRPIDGNDDGGAKYDIGAYEDNPTGGLLRCNFFASTNGGFGSVAVTFTAYVEGAQTNNVQYYWDFENVGVADISGPNLAVVTNTYSGGIHSVSLTVSNATEGFTLVKPNLISVVSDADAHVATNGSHTTPFDTWAKAATNIQAAVDIMQALVAAGGTHHTVWITNGTYGVSVPVTVSGDVVLRSVNGPAVTIVDGNATTLCFTVGNAGAVVDGLTVTNGLGFSDPSGILVNDGLVTNCVISGCHTSRAVFVAGGTIAGSWIVNNKSGNGGGLFLSGGTAVGCVISNNHAYYGLRPSIRGGGGVYMSSGTLADSLIADNHERYGEGGAGGSGLYMTGGLVSNCVIRNNGQNSGGGNHQRGGGVYMSGGILYRSTIVSNLVIAPSSTAGGGIYQLGGLVDRCQIAYNEMRNGGQANVLGGGGVDLNAGVLRNSLIAGNYVNGTVQTSFGGGVRISGGILENCTIVRNFAGGNLSDGGGVSWVAGTITNCISYFNATRPGGTITNLAASGTSFSCAPELVTGTGNISGDPQFINSGIGSGLGCTLGDYHLRSRSPCIEGGTNLTWMSSALDLDGNPRRLRDIVDMGCYEMQVPQGSTFYFR
jgi:hypothetical protein